MKSFLLLFFILSSTTAAKAQSVDSIFFNLYTDSLKKGVHNYINVDGKLSNGRWQPLTAKEIVFSSSAGRFEGNSLIIDPSFTGDKVVVTAVLKTNSNIKKEITIYMKTKINEEPLKTTEEILKEMKAPRRKKKG